MSILLTNDHTPFKKYEKYCQKHGRSYISLIKSEQKFLKKLIKHKYSKTSVKPSLRIVAYIPADFGERTEQDYKILELGYV